MSQRRSNAQIALFVIFTAVFIGLIGLGKRSCIIITLKVERSNLLKNKEEMRNEWFSIR